MRHVHVVRAAPAQPGHLAPADDRGHVLDVVVGQLCPLPGRGVVQNDLGALVLAPLPHDQSLCYLGTEGAAGKHVEAVAETV